MLCGTPRGRRPGRVTALTRGRERDPEPSGCRFLRDLDASQGWHGLVSAVLDVGQEVLQVALETSAVVVLEAAQLVDLVLVFCEIRMSSFYGICIFNDTLSVYR